MDGQGREPETRGTHGLRVRAWNNCRLEPPGGVPG